MNSMNVTERSAEALERRLARVRVDEKATAMTTVMSRQDRGEGNGSPPELSPLAEISAIGELLHGDRWTTALALDLVVKPREVRRWKSGVDLPEGRDLVVARRIARRRAMAILHLVGPGD
jgi:hypothetical protein